MKQCLLVVLCILPVGCHSLTGAVLPLKPDYAELPVAALRDVAREIERAVFNGEREFRIPDRDGIVVNDERIVQAVRMRAARAELVDRLLDSGHAWERRNGHLYIIRNKAYQDATTRHQRDMNALIVGEEAKNRWTVYEGIRKASRLAPRSLGAIQSVFHEARVDCIRPGQKYEDAAGGVTVKGGEPAS